MSLISFFLFCSFSTLHITNGLTSSEQTTVLNWHNKIRRDTRSGQTTCDYGSNNKCPAGTIPDLTWDTSLASGAQTWADKLASECNMYHASTEYGENLAMAASSGSIPAVEPTIDPWATDESKCFEYGNDDSTCSGVAIGHFTQVVWEKTTKVGCACASNSCTFSGRNYNTIYCVCRYNPGGNCEIPAGCSKCVCPDGTKGKPYTEGGSSTPVEEELTTPEPITTISTGGGSSSSINSITIDISHGCFSGMPKILSADTTQFAAVTTKPVYGPFVTSSYCSISLTLYIWYPNVGSDYGEWMVSTQSNIQANYASSFAKCACNDCDIKECTSFSGAFAMTVSENAAYSSSSTSSGNSKSQLIEGLLIGLAIAVGVFILSLCIYLIVKRRNSDKNKYTVVEMNNEISNHDYVTMDN